MKFTQVFTVGEEHSHTHTNRIYIPVFPLLAGADLYIDFSSDMSIIFAFEQSFMTGSLPDANPLSRLLQLAGVYGG